MELILVRHAKAFERDASAWPDDSRRPLTAQGREQFTLLARRLRRIAPEVDLVESSGFVRAWQTAMLLEEHARWPKPARLERLECHDGSGTSSVAGASGGPAGPESLVRMVAAMRGLVRVAWVGHEPMLSQLASCLLAGGLEATSIDFKKGAALALRIEGSIDEASLVPVGARIGDAPGNARPRAALLWMLTPGLVGRMRRRRR